MVLYGVKKHTTTQSKQNGSPAANRLLDRQAGRQAVVRHLPQSAPGEKERRQTRSLLSLHQGLVLSSEAQAISQTVYSSWLDQKARASGKLMGSLVQSKVSGACGWRRMR